MPPSLQTAAAAAGAALLAIMYIRWRSSDRESMSSSTGSTGSSGTSRRSSVNSSAREELLSELDRDCDIVPPLPIPLMRLLSLSEVCQLATVRPDQTPHLCLMRFTYAEGLLILTTQRDTEKFGNLQANPHVAAIFHDIKSVSVTVYGRLREEDDPERAERLRALHAKKNPAYLQFIVGDGIAVMSVDITRVRICNIDDKVTNWEKGMKV